MAVTDTFVAFSDISMTGDCDHCGAAWRATGTKQPGMNDSEPIICPKCGKPAGGTMHCAFGPNVEPARRR